MNIIHTLFKSLYYTYVCVSWVLMMVALIAKEIIMIIVMITDVVLAHSHIIVIVIELLVLCTHIVTL